MTTHAESRSYPKPSLTADIVVVAPEMVGPGGTPGNLQVLLIRRGRDPFQGQWALPGGFCDPGESVEQAAARELEEETRLRGVRLEQIRAFTAPGRDPRGWVVSVAHLALVPARRLAEAAAGDDAHEARWWPLRPAPGGGFRLEADGELAGALAFDHDAILATAVGRLVREVDTLGLDLLEAPFTAEDLAWVHRVARALGRGAAGDGDEAPGPRWIAAPQGAAEEPGEVIAARLAAAGVIRRDGAEGAGEGGKGQDGEARYVAARRGA